MDAWNVEAAPRLSDRVVRDLELFAQHLEDARASADPYVWRTLREELHRITEEIVNADR